MRFALVAALIACNPDPFPPAIGCTEHVFTEDRRSCDCLTGERESAEALLTKMGLEVPHGVTVWIHASDEEFQTRDGSYAWGETVSPDEIVLTRYAFPWAHELLHVRELRDGVALSATAAHTGWAERGWLEITQEWAGGSPQCK